MPTGGGSLIHINPTFNIVSCDFKFIQHSCPASRNV